MTKKRKEMFCLLIKQLRYICVCMWMYREDIVFLLLELTWHYNCELLPDREVKCFCGSKNCRGRLF